jgi:phosphatidylserine/phosphatidylglycerophosphate/cardiolipin synthase-like enzyme
VFASLARLSERCPGLLGHLRDTCREFEITSEESIVASTTSKWTRADILAGLTALSVANALKVERNSRFSKGNSYRPTPTLREVVDRAAAISDVLPILRKHFDEEHQVSLVVTWPSSLQTPTFRRWRASKAALVEMIDDAEKSVAVVFPFIDAGGIDEVAAALERALSRGLSVVLLTRYLTIPSTPNAQFATRLQNASIGHGNFRALNISSDREPKRELLHAKVLVVDEGRRGYVGSANLTGSAFDESIEIGVAVDGAAAESMAELIGELLSLGRST